MLIPACIIYWQAKEITRRVRSGDAAEEDVDARLLRHCVLELTQTGS